MNEVTQKKLELRRLLKRLLLSLAITGVLAACFTVTAHAASVTVDLGSGDGGTSFGILEALLLVTLLAAFNIFQICCPGLMFRWSIMWHVQDPYAAEPSDWYILMERIEWVVLTGVVAVLYWAALTVIY